MAFMMKPLRGFEVEKIACLLLMEPLRGSINTQNQYFNSGSVSSIIDFEYGSIEKRRRRFIIKSDPGILSIFRKPNPRS